MQSGDTNEKSSVVLFFFGWAPGATHTYTHLIDVFVWKEDAYCGWVVARVTFAFQIDIAFSLGWCCRATTTTTLLSIVIWCSRQKVMRHLTKSASKLWVSCLLHVWSCCPICASVVVSSCWWHWWCYWSSVRQWLFELLPTHHHMHNIFDVRILSSWTSNRALFVANTSVLDRMNSLSLRAYRMQRRPSVHYDFRWNRWIVIYLRKYLRKYENFMTCTNW